MPEFPVAGDEFAGYRLQSVIGRGGMSVVYQAEHPRLGNGIALKVLAADLAADDIFRTRFLTESGIAASMDHPHVIPIYDVGLSDGLLFIAMRRVSGTDLRRMIAERGRLEPHTATFLLGQAAEALDAAHRMGLVHRNVKPENLLIQRDDDAGSEHVYLADFGISRLGMARNGLTSTGRFLGTVDYVAPEQMSGPSVYGSADQYSLGCVLYECLTGRVPLDKDLPTDLSAAVNEMFVRVLAERPGDRYNTCREFMQVASVALGDVPSGELAGSPATPGAGDDQAEVAPVSADYQRELTKEVPEQAEEAPAQAEEAPAQAEEAPDQAAGPRPRSGRLLARWLAIAAVLLVFAGIGVGAYAGLSPQGKATGLASAAMASNSPMPSESPMPQRAPASTLARVLAAADASRVAMGRLPASSCKQRGTTKVVCTAPWPTIASATFTTYPTRAALYSAYKAKVRSLSSRRYRQNVKDCGLAAPSPYGEIAWNHQEQHSRAYSVNQMIAGKVPVQTAMGRLACLVTASHSEDIVWTTDYGKMLGVAIGRGSHKGVWYWWAAVHHNIVFPGTPMHMSRKTIPLMSGTSMQNPSASGSPSMSASAS
jgi:serine/threonine protein kinase